MTYGSIGSISSGTLLPADLIPVFADELKDLAKASKSDAYRDLLARADAWIEVDDNMEPGEIPDSDEHDDIGPELVIELMDALGEFAPPYFYFGTHPGDGADFGFWLYEDFQQDFDGLTVSDTSEVPDDYEGEVLHVNDHGNCTLFAARNGELKEIWAVV
jgi:hypothetical protein